MRIFLLLLCVFVAGVFVGIWLDWSAHKHQNITFAVEKNQTANVNVYAGDQISLEDRTGSGGWLFNFVGGSPCAGAKNLVNPCILDSKLGAGAYYFTCSPVNGGDDGCPDPGIQPSPTGPMDAGFLTAVEKDFGVTGGQTPVETETKAENLPLISPIRAVVFCDTSKNPNITAVQDLNHKDLTAITASKGQNVFWSGSGSIQFTLTATTYTDGFCSGGKPDVTDQQYAKCNVNQSKAAMTYTVQAASCNALTGATVTAQ